MCCQMGSAVLDVTRMQEIGDTIFSIYFEKKKKKYM